jgi:serine/threonine protein kinase
MRLNVSATSYVATLCNGADSACSFRLSGRLTCSNDFDSDAQWQAGTREVYFPPPAQGGVMFPIYVCFSFVPAPVLPLTCPAATVDATFDLVNGLAPFGEAVAPTTAPVPTLAPNNSSHDHGGGGDAPKTIFGIPVTTIIAVACALGIGIAIVLAALVVRSRRGPDGYKRLGGSNASRNLHGAGRAGDDDSYYYDQEHNSGLEDEPRVDSVVRDSRYRQLGAIGVGSFGKVLKVLRRSDGAMLALKYIKIPTSRDLADALQEFYVTQRLQQHKNVIHIHDMFLNFEMEPMRPSPNPSSATMSHEQEPLLINNDPTQPPTRRTSGVLRRSIDGVSAPDQLAQAQAAVREPVRVLCLVMDYHHKGDLSNWVRKHTTPVPEPVLVHIALQLFRVLSFIHANGIVHRDLKPENVLIVSRKAQTPRGSAAGSAMRRSGSFHTPSGRVSRRESGLSEEGRGSRADESSTGEDDSGADDDSHGNAGSRPTSPMVAVPPQQQQQQGDLLARLKRGLFQSDSNAAAPSDGTQPTSPVAPHVVVPAGDGSGMLLPPAIVPAPGGANGQGASPNRTPNRSGRRDGGSNPLNGSQQEAQRRDWRGRSMCDIVVTDFGLAKVIEAATDGVAFAGTAAYAAPEAIRCLTYIQQKRRMTPEQLAQNPLPPPPEVGAPADLWSLGCVLVAVMARRLAPDEVRMLWRSASNADFFADLTHELVQVHGYSEGLAALVLRCLEEDPARRITAHEAIAYFRIARDTRNYYVSSRPAVKKPAAAAAAAPTPSGLAVDTQPPSALDVGVNPRTAARSAPFALGGGAAGAAAGSSLPPVSPLLGTDEDGVAYGSPAGPAPRPKRKFDDAYLSDA